MWRKLRRRFRAPLARSYSPSCSLPARDAGISEFLTDSPGFSATIKQTPYDFQVHELDQEGQELHLTSEGFQGPEPMGETWDLRFRLYKEGLDTFGALAVLGRCLRRRCRFAGTKDRTAVTVQQLSCGQLAPAELLHCLEHPEWDSRLSVSNLEVKPRPLNLGDLSGNRFNVVMRGISDEELSSESLRRSCAALERRGFLNYFGTQRFGSQMIRSYHVGAAILAQDLPRALRLQLGDSVLADLQKPAVEEAQRLALKSLDTNNTTLAEEALILMPKRHAVERGLLKSLAAGSSAEEALLRLPRQLLMLYVKSAQSLIFNQVLSQVASSRALDLEDTEAVLPLPGSEVTYPPQLREMYEDASQESLGIPLEAFHARLPLRLSLPGVYRPAVVRPTDVSWRKLPGAAAASLARRQRGRLLLTDRDRLEGAEELDPGDLAPGVLGLRREDGSAGGSLIMSCVLPPSAYFTMAFRELTRQEPTWVDSGFADLSPQARGAWPEGQGA
ncbi:unnamed protein product [Effrenium voratum]|nr:unnamed protein product [Effrenium voratum]